jgi:hypothetical protein
MGWKNAIDRGESRRHRDSNVRNRVALAAGLAFLATALAACGSSGGTPANGSLDGPGLDTAAEHQSPGADASCRAPTASYGPGTSFQTAFTAPQPDVDCPLACGESMWQPSLGPSNVDVALPYGACSTGTPACRATARVPCTCPDAQGPVHGFVCTCESGTWACRIRSQGAAACPPCDGGAD